MHCGKVDVDSCLVMIVIAKPARWSATVMGVPKLPEAYENVGMECLSQLGTAYAEYGDFLDGSHGSFGGLEVPVLALALLLD